MTRATTLMHTRASAWRRHAILEGVVGLALLCVTLLCAAQGETWHATLAALISGATLTAGAMTLHQARIWEREAIRREALPTDGAAPDPA